MAQDTPQAVETPQEIAEQKISNMLFGSDEPEEELVEEPVDEPVDEPDDDIAEPKNEPVVEGDELFEIQLESGAVYEVPAELKDAFVRQKDYTTKTQEVAAQRREAEVIQESVRLQESQYKFVDSVQAEVDEARLLNWQIENYTQHMRDNMANLSDRDILTIRSTVDELKEKKQALSQAVTLKYQNYQQAAEQARKGLRDKSTEVLKQKIPNWSPDLQSEIKAFGQSVGFTEQELENAVDPREWQVLWEASQYRKLQAGKSAAIHKVQGAPQIKPKSRRSPAQDAVTNRLNVHKRLKSSNSSQQKAEIIQDDIARRLGL